MKNSIRETYLSKQINFQSYDENIPQYIYQGMIPYINYQYIDNINEKYYLYNQENKNKNESPMKSTTLDDEVEDKIIPKKKEEKNYIDLLLNTVNKLFEKGDISNEYLNQETMPKFDPYKFNLTLNNINKENNFSKKCDNKICTYLADNPNKLIQAKFYYSSSYKPKNLYLCEKCYKAYSLENYCYYCHIIYREYEHGTQYYDKKKWIQCDYCYKWHHMQCEEKKGKYENIEELSMNNNFKYMCPFCRKEHESIMRQKHKNEKMKKILGYKNNNKNNNNNNFLNIKRKEKKLPLNEVININEFNKISNKNK